MLCKTLLVVTSLAILRQVLGARDLTSDVAAATELMWRVYHNAQEFQPHVAQFQRVLFTDIVPFVDDIEARMVELGIDQAQMEEMELLYDTLMEEMRTMIRDMVPTVGPAYVWPSYQCTVDLNNDLNAPTLTQDVQYLADNNTVYLADFEVFIAELNWRMVKLFDVNWRMIKGTVGWDRAMIDSDRSFIWSMYITYRDELSAHMASLDHDTITAIAATNLVIEQLP